jgi:hypothetical protein
MFAKPDEGVIAMRVEWSKARARRDRWVEELLVLREEMKRVLHTVQREWTCCAEQRTEIDPELATGLKAYALWQVYVHRWTAEAFHASWSGSVAWVVRQVVDRDRVIYRELLEGDGLDRAPALTQAGRSGSEEQMDDAEADEAGATTERVTRASARHVGRKDSV